MEEETSAKDKEEDSDCDGGHIMGCKIVLVLGFNPLKLPKIIHDWNLEFLIEKEEDLKIDDESSVSPDSAFTKVPQAVRQFFDYNPNLQETNYCGYLYARPLQKGEESRRKHIKSQTKSRWLRLKDMTETVKDIVCASQALQAYFGRMKLMENRAVRPFELMPQWPEGLAHTYQIPDRMNFMIDYLEKTENNNSPMAVVWLYNTGPRIEKRAETRTDAALRNTFGRLCPIAAVKYHRVI